MRKRNYSAFPTFWLVHCILVTSHHTCGWPELEMRAAPEVSKSTHARILRLCLNQGFYPAVHILVREDREWCRSSSCHVLWRFCNETVKNFTHLVKIKKHLRSNRGDRVNAFISIPFREYSDNIVTSVTNRANGSMLRLATSRPHEYVRSRSGRASDEVARGRPSSGGYWINKTKDFSESLLHAQNIQCSWLFVTNTGNYVQLALN